jgi:hypothetical protein
MARDRCASAGQYGTWKRRLRTSRYDTIPGAGSDALELVRRMPCYTRDSKIGVDTVVYTSS